MGAEHIRLEEDKQKKASWKKKWGPYLSERQWGTVREDDSSPKCNPARYVDLTLSTAFCCAARPSITNR
jgi:hypothetical protein